MKVSIITATYNSASTIKDTIESIQSQNYKNIEYIIIDGNSHDATLEIVGSYGDIISHCQSEADDGIYDAMNKGIRCATGDIIGILNSDDFYSSTNIISAVVKSFHKYNPDCVFGDLVYVRPENLNKISRYYSSKKFHPKLFAYGWMPAHPTFFVKRHIYEKYGLFKTDYKIAADYELLTRFLAKNRISYQYIPQIMVKMRTGGASTRNLMSNYILNREIIRACHENGIQTNWLQILSKYPTKIFQLVKLPKLLPSK